MLLLLAGCGGFEPDMAAVESTIEDDLSEQIEQKVDLDCPDSIEWRVGGKFRCIAEDKRGERAQIVVHMESDQGDYTWAVTRP